MKHRIYKKEFDYSYALGSFPTIELIQFRSQDVIEVVYHPKAPNSKHFDLIKELCIQKNIPFLENKKSVEMLSSKENTFFVGVFRKFINQTSEDSNHVLLHNPSDLGNVGMIIRSSLGFDIYDIGIIPPGVDIFNPKMIRATMGAFFRSNIFKIDSLELYNAQFKNRNLYFFDLNADTYLHQTNINKPFTFIFGNEAEGLPASYRSQGTWLKIKQSNNINSLNISSSVAISLFYQSIS